MCFLAKHLPSRIRMLLSFYFVVGFIFLSFAFNQFVLSRD